VDLEEVEDFIRVKWEVLLLMVLPEHLDKDLLAEMLDIHSLVVEVVAERRKSETMLQLVIPVLVLEVMDLFQQ